jgi:type II secretory pathway component GspD/PulD (secretin)
MKKRLKILILLALTISLAFSTSYLKNISINNGKDYVIVSFQVNGKDVQYSLYPYLSSVSIDILFDNTLNSMRNTKIISKFLPLENIDIIKKETGTLVKIYTNAKVDYKFDTGAQNGNTFTLNLYLSKKTPLIDVDYTGGKFSTLDSVLKEISKMLGRNIILAPDLNSMKVNLSLKNVRPSDLFNLVLSSVATDIGYTILSDGSYYVAKISDIITKYNITLASLALKLSRETTYKVVVDPEVRNRMITYNSDDFSPNSILKVISLIDGIAYTFVDKDILYISTADKIEKMFSSNYIVKTYDVPADFDPKAIIGILSPNAKLIKITDTSVLLKGLSKDHILLKTILNNIKSKKSSYEIIKTNISPSMLKALKEVFKNVGLVQIKDKLLLTGEPSTIEKIKEFLNNFSNDNYIKVIDAGENANLISTFVNKYFPEINSTSIKNLVILSGPESAVENSINYVDKIKSSLSSVTLEKNGTVQYDIQVVKTSLPIDAVKSIIAEFTDVKLIYNDNSKIIIYGKSDELQILKEQLAKIEKDFNGNSETKNISESSTETEIEIKEFNISGINDNILNSIKQIIDPNLKYFYANNILLIKANQKSIDNFIKYVKYFVPEKSANKSSKTENQIIRDYPLGNLNYDLAKQIISIYYDDIKIQYIEELNKLILKGNSPSVNGAIEKLNSLKSEIEKKTKVGTSSKSTLWIHLNNLKPSEAAKIALNYSKTTNEKIETNAVDSTGYLMLSGNESTIKYLKNIIEDMDKNNASERTTNNSTSTTQTTQNNENIISTVSASEIRIYVKDFSVSNLIYTAAKLLSKNVITKNISGKVSLSVNSIDFDSLLKLLKNESLINYQKNNDKYVISGILSENKQTEIIAPVFVGYNIKEISKIINSLYQIQTVLDESSQTLILKGNAEEVEKAKNLIDQLSKGSDRIYISIKIMSQDVSNKEAYGNSISINQANGNTIKLQNTNGDSQFLGFNINGNKIDFSASKFRNSNTNIISQPNAVTVNGKTVKIHIGQSFSKIINQSTGSNPTSGTIQNSQSIKQFNTGVILSVTPIILMNGDILLSLDLNVSKITGFNDGIPVTENKQVTSTIIVKNGQKVSFGGLEEVTEEKEVQKLPFLGDLPFIGTFFSSSQNIKKKYDLSFEITANIAH